MITLIIGAGLGLGILVAVIWAMLKYPHLPRIERIALGLIGAGLVWGGAGRAMGKPAGLGDLLFLAGVALLVWRFFVLNPKIGVQR